MRISDWSSDVFSSDLEIRDAHQALEHRKYRHTEVLPLYARLSARDQDRVFNLGPQRRIVLATNVAETSLTVPRIHYVVDPGLARVKRYSPRLKLDRLHVEAVSQASADPRKGRCGRLAPGPCRAEERREGKAWVRTCHSRWAPVL